MMFSGNLIAMLNVPIFNMIGVNNMSKIAELMLGKVNIEKAVNEVMHPENIKEEMFNGEKWI